MKKQKEKKGKSGGHPKRRILVALAGSLVLPLIGGTSIHAKAAERGLEFDLDSYIQMEENLGEIPDTIEIILNVKDGVKERQVIFGNYESDSKKSFSVELTADGKLRYYERIVEEGGYVDVRSDEAVKTGEEIQLTVVRDAQNDQISLYQNEKLIKQQQVSYDLKEEDAGQPHFVGTDYRKKYFVQAEISRIALWNDERTESEISSDKSAEIKGDEEDLKNCWELSEDLRNEPRVEDLTENGIGGILNGFKVYEKEGTDFSEGIQRTEMAENLPEAPLTVEAWVKIPEGTTGRVGVICGNYFNKYYRDIPLFNFEVYSDGNPRMYYVVRGQEYQYIAEDVNLCTGKWTHVAMTYDTLTDQMSCYINGELRGEKAVSFNPEKLNQPLAIGRDSRDHMNFKGEIADVRIWSETRTEEEIRGNFDKELEGTEEGLMAWYPLDEMTQDGSFTDAGPEKNDMVPSWMEPDLSEGDYSMAVIPDTQTLTSSYPEKLNRMMDWLKENKERYNIGLALQMGDLVNSNYNQSEWDRVSSAFQRLDGSLPYVFVPGNHDTDVRNTEMFNKNFPYEKYSKESSFGGAFEEGKMDNTYSYFNLGNAEFMTIALEPAPRAEVIAWANEIAEQNQDKNIIVLTHAYMNYDGNRTNDDSQDQPNYENNAFTGDEMWEGFASQHSNIVMVLSGHVGYPDLVVTEAAGVNGNKVQQVLCDAQFFESETDGAAMLMLMTFHNDSNLVDVNWYSTDRDQNFRARNQFTMEVNLQKKNTADMSALNLIITMAEKLESEQSETGCYTEETWAAVQSALDAARTLAENAEASQEDVDNAFLELITAVNLLENAVQRVALQTAIEGAKAILAEEEALADYTPESVENLRTVLADAERVYAEAGADQETVNAAARSLMDAVTSLVVIDKDTRLDILIQKAEELLASADQYTSASVSALNAALEAAYPVADDRDASEEQINAAYSSLAEAMSSLVRKADKSELQIAIDKAAEILADTSKYVEESVAGLQAAADAAQAVYDKEDADAAEVGEAVKSLVDEILKARLLGDVDGNGTVDTADSAEVLKAAAEAQTLDEMQSLAADVNGDGAADSSDAAEILVYAAEGSTGF